MSRREAWLSAAAVFAVALGVRLVAAPTVVFPIPEDTAYYVNVARNLLEGEGLVSDAIWSFQTPPLEFPRPAFEVWLPLPTLLIAAVQAVLGTTFAVAQLVPVLAGAASATLAWRLAADVAADRPWADGRRRTFALGVGLTCAVYFPLVLHSVLPDSTLLFTALALGFLVLVERLVAQPRGWRVVDPRLVVAGLLLGLCALTRNEAAWLAIVWVVAAWRVPGTTRPERIRAIAVVGALSLAVFVPWAIRDWLVFGNPLPGQAVANAFSISGSDIFAWSDPPTLARYLAEGPAFMVSSRVVGTLHNLLNVLVYLGLPVSVIGLAALPWTWRPRPLRPLLLFSAITFLVTSLAFPVATTWGTFLHAAGPVHVLLVVSCLLGLDRAIEWIGVRRGWTRPVAWLGPALAIFASVVFSVALLPGFGAQSRAVQERYEALEAAFAENGTPIATVGPIVTNFPIWLAESTDAYALALPVESPESVLSLVDEFPGTQVLVVTGEHGIWPDVLDSGAPGAECFTEVALAVPGDPELDEALDDTRAWRIACP